MVGFFVLSIETGVCDGNKDKKWVWNYFAKKGLAYILNKHILHTPTY